MILPREIESRRPARAPRWSSERRRGDGPLVVHPRPTRATAKS